MTSRDVQAIGISLAIAIIFSAAVFLVPPNQGEDLYNYTNVSEAEYISANTTVVFEQGEDFPTIDYFPGKEIILEEVTKSSKILINIESNASVNVYIMTEFGFYTANGTNFGEHSEEVFLNATELNNASHITEIEDVYFVIIELPAPTPVENKSIITSTAEVDYTIYWGSKQPYNDAQLFFLILSVISWLGFFGALIYTQNAKR